VAQAAAAALLPRSLAEAYAGSRDRRLVVQPHSDAKRGRPPARPSRDDPTGISTPTTTFASMWLLRLKSAVPEYHLDLTVLTETNDEGMFPRPSRRCRYENHRFHFGDGGHFHRLTEPKSQFFSRRFLPAKSTLLRIH
jgi:hypothetical protein